MIVANSKTCVSEKLRMAIFFAQPKGNYYPFGKESRGSSTPNEPKEQFTGKERDIETGLDYFGARYYNAEIGRWVSVDPMSGKYPSLTPYNYTANNPINQFDPDGKFIVGVHYKITYEAMKSLGIGNVQSDRVAHYASMYADHPKQGYVDLNNGITPFLSWGAGTDGYRSGIDYSGTMESQNEDNLTSHLWHGTRNEYENISASARMEQTLEWGWGKVFESAASGNLEDLADNSAGAQSLGQGVHALQDATIHRGATYPGQHSVWDDVFGSTSEAESLTSSALVVHQILNGNFKNVKAGMNLNISGMNATQKRKVIQSLQGQGYKVVEDEEK